MQWDIARHPMGHRSACRGTSLWFCWISFAFRRDIAVTPWDIAASMRNIVENFLVSVREEFLPSTKDIVHSNIISIVYTVLFTNMESLCSSVSFSIFFSFSYHFFCSNVSLDIVFDMLFQNVSRKHSNITFLLRKKTFKKKDVFLPVHKYRITNTFCTVFPTVPINIY